MRPLFLLDGEKQSQVAHPERFCAEEGRQLGLLVALGLTLEALEGLAEQAGLQLCRGRIVDLPRQGGADRLEIAAGQETLRHQPLRAQQERVAAER